MTEPQKSLGRIVTLSGEGMTGLLSRGEAVPEVSIGMLVKAVAKGTRIYGLVSSLRVENAGSGGADERRLFEVDLLGELVERRNGNVQRVFQRGVSVYPPLDAPIYAATPEDYAAVYTKPQAANIPIGTIYHSNGLPAYLTLNDLLSKHFAILGTTGTGKSSTVALLLRRILSHHPFGHVILLDPHNEYASAFADLAEQLNTSSLKLPYWLFNGEEMGSILIGRDRGREDARVPILNAAILAAKRQFLGPKEDTSHITADTPSPYRITAILDALREAMGRLDKPEGLQPYRQLAARIEALARDVRYAFMFETESLVVRDVMTDIMSRLLRVPVAGKPITIIDLSAVPSEITDTVVSVLARLVFDFCLWAEPIQALPVLLVCEEAHRYIPEHEGRGFEPSKRILSQIAKEGRKYGVALGLVSQRPSELSSTILSQCSTLFALRMGNELDQRYVRNALPESASSFLTALSSLRTQEGIVVGEGVSVPMRLMFDDLEPQHLPRSGNAIFSAAWKDDDFGIDCVATIVDRWRRQTRISQSPRPTPAGPPDPAAAWAALAAKRR